MKPQTKAAVSKKKKHTGLKILITFLILIMLTLAIVPFFINPIADSLVKQQVAALFGNKLTIGSVSISLWTGATVKIHQIDLKQPPKYRQGSLAKAESIRVRVALMPLLKQQLLIHDITVVRPEITLVQTGNGNLNIDYYLEQFTGKPAADSGPAFTVRLKHFRIKQGKITVNSYALSNRQPTFVLTDCNLTMRNLYLPNSHKNATQFSFTGILGTEHPAPVKVRGTGVFGSNTLSFSMKSNVDDLTLADYAFLVPDSSFNIKSGKAWIISDTRCNNNYLRSYHHVNIKDLKIAPKKGHAISGTLLGVPGNIFVKFIEDRNGVFDIDFTVSGPFNELKANIKFHVIQAVTKSIRSKLGIGKITDKAVSGIKKAGKKVSNAFKGLFKGKNK